MGFVLAFGFGPEWVIILLIIVILFGGKKIPEVAKGLGEGIRGFKTGLQEDPNKKTEDRKSSESKERPR